MGLILGLGAGLLMNLYADRDLGTDRGRNRGTRWLGTGVLAAAMGVHLQQHCGTYSRCLVALGMCALLVLIAIIDLYQRRIPNVLLAFGGLLAVTNVLLDPSLHWRTAAVGALVGLGLFALISLGRRNALGAGDVKLAALIGLMTGFPAVLQALILGILAGGLAAAALMLTGARTGKQYIPYAPYLVAGALTTLLYGTSIARWYVSAFQSGG